MKLRILSDLHEEFFKTNKFDLEQFLQYNGEDVLVLAGDIAVGHEQVIKVFNKFLATGFPHIVYVSGNHEYYGTTIAKFDVALRTTVEGLGMADRVHILSPYQFWTHDDVVFFGDILWTNFGDDPLAKHAACSMVSDFKRIEGFSTANAETRFYNALDSIEEYYQLFDQYKKCIVTHFLPAVECIAPQYKGESLVNKYFANDLGEWISTLDNTTWIFGHTHTAMDFDIGTTRMVCNPHGYVGYERRDGFDPFKVVEL